MSIYSNENIKQIEKSLFTSLSSPKSWKYLYVKNYAVYSILFVHMTE